MGFLRKEDDWSQIMQMNVQNRTVLEVRWSSADLVDSAKNVCLFSLYIHYAMSM